nr:hypothetical protein [Tanacetum cinerariifolium]
MLPGELRTSSRVPTYLNNCSTTFLQMIDFTVYDFDRGSKETHLKAENYTKSLGKETQAWVYTDCHLGNPCDPNLHLTAQDFDKMKDLEGLAAIKGALVLAGKSS